MLDVWVNLMLLHFTDLDAFQGLFKTVLPPERLMCLGLGSLVDGEAHGVRISEVQLILLLELRKLVNVPSQIDGN